MNERVLLVICIVITIILAIGLVGLIYYVGANNLISAFSKSSERILSDLEEMRDNWHESEVEDR